MGISMAHVMNTIRSGAASLPSSLPTSPLSIADDDDNSIFYRFRSAVQKKLNCASKRQDSTCDSDGGIDYYTPGTIFNHSITGTNLVDSCIPLSNLLLERHCVSADPANYTVLYECPNGCSNGACIP